MARRTISKPKIDRSTNQVDWRLAVAVCLAGCGTEVRAELEAPGASLPVDVVKVARQSRFNTRKVFSGTVRSSQASQLGFERGGKLARVLVEEGQSVRSGDPIAVLDTQQLVVARKRVRAALTRARAQRGLSDLTANRVEALAKKAFAPTQEADEARFGRDAARATVDELEASLAQIDVDLRKSTLRAPYSGLVTAQLIDAGTVVPAGAPVIRLQGRDGKEVFIGVALADATALTPGTTAEVEVAGTVVAATVTGRVDDVDPRTRTVGVVLALPLASKPIDGDVARLRLERSTEGQGAWLPITALTQGPKGTWTVYALPPGSTEGVLRRESLTILHQEASRAFVQGTLSDGDLVVARGTRRVVNGQRVRVAGRTAP